MLQSVTASASTTAAEASFQSAGSGGGDDVRQSDDAAAGAAGRDMLSAGGTSLTKLCGMQFQAAEYRKAVCIVCSFLFSLASGW